MSAPSSLSLSPSDPVPSFGTWTSASSSFASSSSSSSSSSWPLLLSPLSVSPPSVPAVAQAAWGRPPSFLLTCAAQFLSQGQSAQLAHTCRGWHAGTRSLNTCQGLYECAFERHTTQVLLGVMETQPDRRATLAMNAHIHEMEKEVGRWIDARTTILNLVDPPGRFYFAARPTSPLPARVELQGDVAVHLVRAFPQLLRSVEDLRLPKHTSAEIDGFLFPRLKRLTVGHMLDRSSMDPTPTPLGTFLTAHAPLLESLTISYIRSSDEMPLPATCKLPRLLRLTAPYRSVQLLFAKASVCLPALQQLKLTSIEHDFSTHMWTRFLELPLLTTLTDLHIEPHDRAEEFKISSLATLTRLCTLRLTIAKPWTSPSAAWSVDLATKPSDDAVHKRNVAEFVRLCEALARAQAAQAAQAAQGPRAEHAAQAGGDTYRLRTLDLSGSHQIDDKRALASMCRAIALFPGLETLVLNSKAPHKFAFSMLFDRHGLATEDAAEELARHNPPITCLVAHDDSATSVDAAAKICRRFPRLRRFEFGVAAFEPFFETVRGVWVWTSPAEFDLQIQTHRTRIREQRRSRADAIRTKHGRAARAASLSPDPVEEQPAPKRPKKKPSKKPSQKPKKKPTKKRAEKNAEKKTEKKEKKQGKKQGKKEKRPSAKNRARDVERDGGRSRAKKRDDTDDPGSARDESTESSDGGGGGGEGGGGGGSRRTSKPRRRSSASRGKNKRKRNSRSRSKSRGRSRSASHGKSHGKSRGNSSESDDDAPRRVRHRVRSPERR